MSLQEIEIAISELPASDVMTLAEWFAEYQEQLWDKQIEEDAKAGRLDALINEAEQEIREGKTRAL
jgi:hypothetical protein